MSTNDKPIVLIVGAGLGGLFLGALLEKAKIPYTIFESAAVVKPLGSAMTVGPALLPIFQQLGIYDDLVAIGKYMTHVEAFKESLQPYRPVDWRPFEEFAGYGQYIVTRPKLHELFLKQISPHKIHFGKRVRSISENSDKVTIHTTDNNTYEGDILVGADGAYSAVRQSMYEQLKAKAVLPESDQEDLPFSCTCLVGQTKVLDPEVYPIIKKPVGQFFTLLGEEGPYTWAVFTTAQSTLSYMVYHHLPRQTSKAVEEERAKSDDNAEWDATPTQTMCNETRDFRIPIDIDGRKMTMGDLYDLTPKELISKVGLEEKVFETWHHGRTVLLGDACHKLHPNGGQGAVTAIHDGIALANLLYAMPSMSSLDITNTFEEYRNERYPAAKEAFENSQLMSKITDRSLMGAVIFYLYTNMPMWLWRMMLVKLVRFRPQAGFLEALEVKGNVVPVPSPSEKKARAIFEKQQLGAVFA
ncbi:hypothetical protein BG015_006590 [Linnemannia schmuckeri]|uniref:FAD-binding domain-containing protein n=1 Tax=Linnemannia schmuckeri TaxID=64567 RepID=A0A9P5S2A7_9FUNG|nr:hypothetical protein BG015_006590 [Linnemannia schmuckeri]